MSSWLAIGGCGGGEATDADGAPGGDAGGIVRATVGGLGVEIDQGTGSLTIRDPAGDVLLEGLPGSGDAPFVGAAFRAAQTSWQQGFGNYLPTETLEPWKVARGFADARVDDDGVVRFTLAGGVAGAGEIREIATGVVRVALSTPQAERATMAFRCRPDEHFTGFGAQTRDVDHRGYSFPMFVTEQGNGRVDDETPAENWFVRGTRHQTSVAIPFFVSSAAYGVLADTDYRSYFSMCDPDEHADAWRVEAWDREVAFYLFHGADLYQVLQRHTDLVGRPPVPPAFVFAPWNDAVGGAAAVRAMADFLRVNDIPSSAIWSEDWAGSSGDEERLFLDHNWKVSRALYPDIEAMTDELHTAGFKFLGYFSAFAYTDRPVEDYVNDHYSDGIANGYFVANDLGAAYEMAAPRLLYYLTLTDLTNAAAVDWLVGHMDAAMDLGLDGWMADYGEWMPLDGVTSSGADPLAYHNRYPVEWQRANERALGARTDDVERIVFVRSGYTGSQGIAHQIVWGGDQATDFGVEDGLPTIIPIGLGLGAVGLPYYGSDIAGYSEWSSTDPGLSPTGTPTTKELFLRWTSAAAFMPVMRTHHGRNAAGNWDLQSDAESTAHFRRYARLHIQLFPYFRSLAEHAAASGAPLMRAIPLEFPADDAAWSITDQYLLGAQLLVAPVVEQGASSRSVYLPAADWLPFDGGDAISGPTTITASAPVTEIPVYVRTGTVLVLLPDTIDTLAPESDAEIVGLGDVGDDREVRAYLGADGQFDEPGGLSYALAFDHAPASGVVVAWNDAPLSACASPAVAPCALVDEAAATVVAHVVGDGVLSISDGGGTATTLTTTGGEPGRALTLRVFW